MKPALGRIVHVIVDPSHNNGSDEAAAVITRVWNDQAVNVRVLFDGPAVPPEHAPGRQDWMTSVRLRDSRQALEAEHARVEAVWQQSGNGPVPLAYFGAFWPAGEGHQPGDRPRQY